MSGKENYPWQDFGFLDTRHFHFLKWPFLHPHFSNYFSPFSLLRKKKILSFCTYFHSFCSSFSYSSTYKIFSSFSFSVFLNLSKKTCYSSQNIFVLFLLLRKELFPISRYSFELRSYKPKCHEVKSQISSFNVAGLSCARICDFFYYTVTLDGNSLFGCIVSFIR